MPKNAGRQERGPQPTSGPGGTSRTMPARRGRLEPEPRGRPESQGTTDPILESGRAASQRPPGVRELPVNRLRKRIVEKVFENRVTIVFAGTGSGKSSQVPQMLLDEGLGPILCTQPRRLAVVAVAKRVSEERGCVLGEEVGYQVGQLNVRTARTKIVFKTAGILFEELRINGVGALANYKVVILDEVHERSIESDLVLACIKQLLRTSGIKLVLMSATADFARYEEYFKDVDHGERVAKISVLNIAEQFQHIILNSKVVYLEKTVKLLGSTPQHTAVLDEFEQNFTTAVGMNLEKPTELLIRDLVMYCHRSESDLSKSILVFLPTYRTLELQEILLKDTCAPFQVFALHSSIDMDHSIRAMEACPRERRKIILATNVAESSVTISGVSVVIDSCRSLEVYWDNEVKKDQSRMVWVSESQANQRKGRTGRTCDGVVYRLVPRKQFLCLEKFEKPAILLQSLRKQALMILCSSSKALNDPAALLGRCMNTPAPETVQDALEALELINAVCNAKGKYKPTLYGQLLVSLPLSLEASMLAIRGGTVRCVRESAVLAAIMDSAPNPILKPFGNVELHARNLRHYYTGEDDEIDYNGVHLPHTTIILANLYAFEFWQQSFKNKQRVDDLVRKANNPSLHSGHSRESESEDFEAEWCSRHALSKTALHAVAETADIIMEALHRYRPKFMTMISGPPLYVRTDFLQHSSCSGELSNVDSTIDMSGIWNGLGTSIYQESLMSPNLNAASPGVKPSYQDNYECKICAGVPYTRSGTFHSLADEKILSALIVEAKRGNRPHSVSDEALVDLTSEKARACSFFRMGMCNKGTKCLYSHSLAARPEFCRYFNSPNGCRYGDNCMFLHHDPGRDILPPGDGLVHFDDSAPTVESMLDVIPHLQEDELVLLFGEGDFSFAQALSRFIDPSAIMATSLDDAKILKDNSILMDRINYLSLLHMSIIWKVDVTSLFARDTVEGQHFRSQNKGHSIPWSRVKCTLWNFPFVNLDQNSAEHHILMNKFFASLAIIMLTHKRRLVPVIITLCNDQYCRWQVERAARNSFFFLKTSVLFDVNTFLEYSPMRNNLESTFPWQQPMIYAFEFHPPSEAIYDLFQAPGP